MAGSYRLEILEKRHTMNPSRMMPAITNSVRGVNQFFVAIVQSKDKELVLIIFPFEFMVE